MEHDHKQSAFTLLELLTVICIISALTALLLPAVRAGFEFSRLSQCSSNLRQLFLANQLFATEHGYYVPAAADMHKSKGAHTINTKRWHGERDSGYGPFDGNRSPLLPYLGSDKKIRTCPSFRKFKDSGTNAFEASCGGYGYNSRGVGSQAYIYGDNSKGDKKGMMPGAIRHPAQTVMFTDAAHYNKGDIVEYSFAESYRWLKADSNRESGIVEAPTIHFRHKGKANVVWCDGHLSTETMTVEKNKTYTEHNLGWFGPADNTLFDPY